MPTQSTSKTDERRTLVHWIDALDHHGDRLAVIALEKEDVIETSYELLDDLSSRLVAGLKQHDLGQGDLVALFASSSPAGIAACLGIIRAGAMPVLLDGDSLVHARDDSQPCLLFSDGESHSRIAELELDQSPRSLSPW